MHADIAFDICKFGGYEKEDQQEKDHVNDRGKVDIRAFIWGELDGHVSAPCPYRLEKTCGQQDQA